MENILFSIEAERRTTILKKFMDLISDLKNITDVDDWKFMYFDKPTSIENKIQPMTQQTLPNVIPLSPKKYLNSKTAVV